jgi:hypothetical protein
MARKSAKANGRELIELPVNGSEDSPEVVHTLQKVLTIARMTVDSSVKNKDPQYLLSCIRGEFSARHTSDISAIELCYLGQKHWEEFGIDGEFLDYARDYVGKGVETIRRYSQIGKMEEFVPIKWRGTLWCRPVRNLIAIAQAVNEHGNFSEDEWHALSRCVNGQEVRMRLEEILQKERKATNRLTITIDRDGGLTAVKRGKRASIGMLLLAPGNELIAEAVQRIISSAGILEI